MAQLCPYINILALAVGSISSWNEYVCPTYTGYYLNLNSHITKYRNIHIIYLCRMFLTLLLTLHGHSCEPNNVVDCLPERCKCFAINGTEKYYRADCSWKGLTFVPNFPDNITEINLSHNPLNYIHSNDNKNMSSKLNRLDLSHCGLKTIESGFLRKFFNLTYLDISYNRELTLEVLPNVTYDLQNTSIRTFKFDALHCEVGSPNIVRLDHIYYLQNTSLEEMHLCSNRIEELERGVIIHLPQTLQRINAADNRVKVGWYLLEINSMKNIAFANLSMQYKSYDQYMTMFQPSCNDRRKVTIHRKIHHRNIQRPPERNTPLQASCLEEYLHLYRKKRFAVFICLPESLKIVIMDHSALHSSDLFNFTFMDFRAFQKYTIRDNFGLYLTGRIFSSNLTHADYSNNFISDIDPQFFDNANLSHLDFSNNFLGEKIDKEGRLHVLQDQVFLSYLSLAKNRIHSIPKLLFDNLTHLTELDLSGNNIQSMTFSLTNLIKLEFIHLQNNRIKSLSRENMQDLQKKRKNLLTVDLTGNEFLCSCDTLEFLKWMKKHRSTRIISFKNFEEYKCIFSNSTLKSFTDLSYLIMDLEKQCSSYAGVIVGSVAIVTTVIVSVIVGLVYRWRWRLRYIYYMAKRAYKRNTTTQNLHQNDYRNIFRYDAFVSYSTDDRTFALHDMMREIESKTDLRLCFHERDFLPGYDIAENIANAIHDSRKIVCVISNSYLSSHWCMYEFNMALMERIHGREGEDMLMLVLTKTFDTKNVSRPMFEFIRSNSYLEFPDDVACVSMFWDKLIESLSLC